jgi:predicted AlkP superfamily phosphohydrolase/phosphomutase
MVIKSMIIGLDSIVPNFVKKFADEGTLPNIKKLIDEGVFGEGFCTYPSLTGTNWTSIVCGTWPGTQGTSHMWTHFQGESLDIVHSSFLSTSSRSESLWETGEKIGKKSIIMKYPCTTPPTIKNSIQIEGSGAPWYGLNPFEIAPCMCFSNKSYPKAQKIILKHAKSWTNSPRSFMIPLETKIELKSKTSDSRIIYNILIVDLEDTGYNKVIISHSKDVSEAVAVLSEGQWSEWLQDEFEAKIPNYILFKKGSEIIYEKVATKRITGTYRFKLIKCSPDGNHLRLYQSQIFPTTGYTWPEKIAKELLDNIGPFQEHIGPTANFNNWIDDETFLEELEYQAQWLGKASKFLMSRYDWDMYFVQWHGANHAGHTFWGGIDPISPWFSKKNEEHYWNSFRRFYKAADTMIGKIIEVADESTLIIITSDHGHIPYVFGSAMISNALINAGLLHYNKLGNNYKVDWSKTRAYPHSGHIYINLKERDPQGIVEQNEYEDVCNEVISTLFNIRDSKGVCPFSLVLKKKEAELIGLYGDRVGDVIYSNSAGYSSLIEPTEDLEEFKFLNGDISVTDDWGDRQGPLPANTSIHGSNFPSSSLGLGSIRVPLIMHGPKIKKGYLMRNRFRLIDIAPTISYIMGMPYPKHSEGSIGVVT